VKTPQGKLIPLEMNFGDFIQIVKAEIKEKEGFSFFMIVFG
jgi:hypothetical protein